MKTCLKRVFCPACGKLVRCHEEKAEHGKQITCQSGHGLRIWNGVRWTLLTPE
jgi:hypothetical protein